MTDTREARQDLGVRIRGMREELTLSTESLARQASTTTKYIRALEEGDYNVFGALVYAQGILKKMVQVMAPERVSEFSGQLREAWGGQEENAPVSIMARGNRKNFLYLNPARVGIGVIAIAFTAIVFFSGIRLFRFSAPPVLVVASPVNGAVVREPVVEIKGRTERESKLTVNGRELTIDRQGDFHERIEVQIGVNRLELLSENRFGKSSSAVRYVVVE